MSNELLTLKVIVPAPIQKFKRAQLDLENNSNPSYKRYNGKFLDPIKERAKDIHQMFEKKAYDEGLEMRDCLFQ